MQHHKLNDYYYKLLALDPDVLEAILHTTVMVLS